MRTKPSAWPKSSVEDSTSTDTLTFRIFGRPGTG